MIERKEKIIMVIKKGRMRRMIKEEENDKE